jgi:hypothetical protein
MLKPDQIKTIAGFLKIKETDLSSAITAADEVELTIPDDMHVLTQTELDARDTAQKNEGIKAGKEIGAKEVRTAAGIDETVGKDPKKIADAIKAAAVKDAKIPADEKNALLTTQVSDLQKLLQDKDKEIETEKSKATSFIRDREILTAMPKNRSELLQDDEMLDVIKAKHVKEIDGKLVVVGSDGQPLKDPKTTNVLDLQSGLLKVFSERKGWLTDAGSGGSGGRGGKDEKGGGSAFTKKSEVIEWFEKEGKSITGEASKEIVAKLAELKKADATFDMDN